MSRKPLFYFAEKWSGRLGRRNRGLAASGNSDKCKANKFIPTSTRPPSPEFPRCIY
jgi:hypothetical protein